MHHFADLSEAQRERLFEIAPAGFDADTQRMTLATALGAVLYTPAPRAGVAEAILAGRLPGLTTLVLCLEDAICDADLAGAERACLSTLEQLARAVAVRAPGHQHVPLLFVRVRSPDHLAQLAPRLLPFAGLLTGVSLPKFSAARGRDYLELLSATAGGGQLWAMPILESPELIHRESRGHQLALLSQLLEQHRRRVLCLRIGGTDLSGHFGLRRSSDLTIYDLAVVRDCIADIVNVFGRTGSDYVISGPVWEYFSADRRLLKPQLRTTPFREQSGDRGERLRGEIISQAIDGLIREVLLDSANGLVGKTVIHPSHIAPVHALSAVRSAEYADAASIVRSEGGAFRSPAGDRMNETRPHSEWAHRVLRRAHVYGVLRESQSYISLLEAARVPALV